MSLTRCDAEIVLHVVLYDPKGSRYNFVTKKTIQSSLKAPTDKYREMKR